MVRTNKRISLEEDFAAIVPLAGFIYTLYEFFVEGGWERIEERAVHLMRYHSDCHPYIQHWHRMRLIVANATTEVSRGEYRTQTLITKWSVLPYKLA